MSGNQAASCRTAWASTASLLETAMRMRWRARHLGEWLDWRPRAMSLAYYLGTALLPLLAALAVGQRRTSRTLARIALEHASLRYARAKTQC